MKCQIIRQLLSGLLHFLIGFCRRQTLYYNIMRFVNTKNSKIANAFYLLQCHNEEIIKLSNESQAHLPTVQILLYKFTHKAAYKRDIEATLSSWMPGGSVPYTPGGMAYRLQWGALRYAGRSGLILRFIFCHGI